MVQDRAILTMAYE